MCAFITSHPPADNQTVPADDVNTAVRRSRRPARVPASPFALSAFLGRKTTSRDALNRTSRGGGGLDSAEKRSDDGCPASWEI